MWCDKIDSFVYAEGKKIRTCNADGANRKTLYRISGIGSVSLRAVIEQYAVIRRVTKGNLGASVGDGVYSFIDLSSGILTTTEIPAYTGITPIAAADGWLYYGTGSAEGNYADIRRCNLETGKCEIITDEIDEYISHPGCVSGEYLYFRNEYGDVFRVPVCGGEVENLKLCFSDVGTKGAAGLIGYNGTVLITCLRRNADAEVSLCIFSLVQENRTIQELCSFQVDSAYHLTSLRIQEDKLIASSINPPIFLCANLR